MAPMQTWLLSQVSVNNAVCQIKNRSSLCKDHLDHLFILSPKVTLSCGIFFFFQILVQLPPHWPSPHHQLLLLLLLLIMQIPCGGRAQAARPPLRAGRR